MPFSASWHKLLDHLEDLPPDTTFITPLSRKSFRVTDVQEHRVIIEYRDDSETVPLQCEQFETLYERVGEVPNGFDLSRLPTDAKPYATVLSVHPRFEVDDRVGILTEMDSPTSPTTPPIDSEVKTDEAAREDNDIRCVCI